MAYHQHPPRFLGPALLNRRTICRMGAGLLLSASALTTSPVQAPAAPATPEATPNPFPDGRTLPGRRVFATRGVPGLQGIYLLTVSIFDTADHAEAAFREHTTTPMPEQPLGSEPVPQTELTAPEVGIERWAGQVDTPLEDAMFSLVGLAAWAEKTLHEWVLQWIYPTPQNAHPLQKGELPIWVAEFFRLAKMTMRFTAANPSSDNDVFALLPSAADIPFAKVQTQTNQIFWADPAPLASPSPSR